MQKLNHGKLPNTYISFSQTLRLFKVSRLNPSMCKPTRGKYWLQVNNKGTKTKGYFKNYLGGGKKKLKVLGCTGTSLKNHSCWSVKNIKKRAN